MTTATYLTKIDIEMTQLQMITYAINDLSSLQLNCYNVTEGNRCKIWHTYF